MRNTAHNLRYFLCLSGMLFFIVSCTRADIVADMSSLRRQIEQNDPDVVTVLTASSEARSYLQTIHPGAQFYLALSLKEHKQFQEASVLLKAQLEAPVLAWKGPSFRAWLACLEELKAWDEIIGQSPTLLKKATAIGTGLQAQREIDLSTEAWQKAMLNAFSQLKKVDKSWEFARSLLPVVHADSEALGEESDEAPPETAEVSTAIRVAELGQTSYPAWLLSQLARSSLLRFEKSGVPLSLDVIDDLVPYVLGVDAAEGHGELYWNLLAITATKPQVSPTERALLKILQAKDLLARNQAVAAYNIFREFLLPAGKAKAKDISEATLLQKGLFTLFDRFDKRAGLPAAFFRDFFNAIRLSGQLSDGIGRIDVLSQQIVDTRPAYKRSALRPYILELKARLLRAKGDHKDAAVAFEQALAFALEQEKAGVFAVADRRRIQWYLLRSLTDQYESPGTGPSLDARAFVKVAQATDDTDYFSDVMERGVLLVGGRDDWKGVEILYDGLATQMDTMLRARCALVLARVAQITQPTNAAQKAQFERFSIAARDGSESLYYRTVAAWMRGEPIDLTTLLTSQKMAHEFDEVISNKVPMDPNDFASQISEGYVATGMLELGASYIWDHRKDIGNARFTRIGMQYVAAGRYRQGLRMLESIRVRVGHPTDSTLLAAFYPEPFQEELKKGIEGTTVPEWLMYALVRTESNFDTGADSVVGARGLAQLMPATAKLVASGLGLQGFDLLSPAVNLKLGSVFLQDQYTTTGQWPQALAAYNAGIGRVRGWIRKGMNPDPILFSELIPFDETRNYVRRIIESSLLYTQLYYHIDPTLVLSLLYKKSDTSGR